MTDSDRSMTYELYQSLIRLRWSIDAAYCAASMLPMNGDEEPVAHLFQILTDRLQGDLVVVFNVLADLDAQIVKR
ncbi:TPA: hypothetical protein ACWV7F_004986 [Salmonella enterica subsp. enterica serovar Muenchen]